MLHITGIYLSAIYLPNQIAIGKTPENIWTDFPLKPSPNRIAFFFVRSSALYRLCKCGMRANTLNAKLGLETCRVYYNMIRKKSTQPNGTQFVSEILFIVFLRFGDLTCYYYRKFFPFFCFVCSSCQSGLFFHCRDLWSTAIKPRAIRLNFLSLPAISLALTGAKKK